MIDKRTVGIYKNNVIKHLTNINQIIVFNFTLFHYVFKYNLNHNFKFEDYSLLKQYYKDNDKNKIVKVINHYYVKQIINK